MTHSLVRGHFVARVIALAAVASFVLPAAPAVADDPSQPPSSVPPSSQPPASDPPSSIPPSSTPPSSAPPVSAPPSSVVVPPSDGAPFPDVPLDHPHRAAIAWAKARGIIGGYSDGTFKPARAVSRVEALKMIYLTFGGAPEDNGQPSGFPDLGDGAWYLPFVRAAVAGKVVVGYSDGTFKPDRTVSRVEFIKVAFKQQRVNIYSTGAGLRFSDMRIGRWFVPYVNLTVIAKLMDVPGDSFRPDEGMARQDVAEFLYRMQRALADGTIPQMPEPERTDDGKLVYHARGSGYVSFYSDSLAGSGTASGEKYDPQAMTCAHPLLPFNTVVTLTNPDTRATTTCRVNDRGPFARNRIFDLSRAVFESFERPSAGVTLAEWSADVVLE